MSITKEDIQRLQESVTVKRWTRNISKSSVKNYSRAMIMLLRARGFKDPDALLEWCRTREDPLTVEDMIAGVSDTIEGKGARFNFNIAIRSFLRNNRYNQLGKSNISYTLSEWHRGYKKEEVRKLLGFLDDRTQKLYVYLCLETGFRAQTVLDLKWKHVKTDILTAYKNGDGKEHHNMARVLLGPEFYSKKKSAGYWCIGKRSLDMLRELYFDKEKNSWRLKDEDRLVDRSYMTMWKVLNKARDKAGIDKTVQLSHGLRKYFENALDQAGLDHDRKMVYEGHFAGVRAKEYTSRDWDLTVNDFDKSYRHIDPENIESESIRKVEESLQGWEKEKAELLRRFQEEKESMAAEVLKKMEEWKNVIEASERLGPYLEMMEKANLSPEELKEFFTLVREKAKKGKP